MLISCFLGQSNFCVFAMQKCKTTVKSKFERFTRVFSIFYSVLLQKFSCFAVFCLIFPPLIFPATFQTHFCWQLSFVCFSSIFFSQCLNIITPQYGLLLAAFMNTYIYMSCFVFAALKKCLFAKRQLLQLLFSVAGSCIKVKVWEMELNNFVLSKTIHTGTHTHVYIHKCTHLYINTAMRTQVS